MCLMCEVEHSFSTNLRVYYFRRSHWMYSVRKLILKILQDSQGKTPVSESLFWQSYRSKPTTIKKGTLAQLFSCDSCELIEHLRTNASVESSAFHRYIFHKSNKKPPMIRNSYGIRVFLEQAMGNEYRSRPSILWKLRLRHRCFPVYFGKFLRALFL